MQVILDSLNLLFISISIATCQLLQFQLFIFSAKSWDQAEFEEYGSYYLRGALANLKYRRLTKLQKNP